MSVTAVLGWAAFAYVLLQGIRYLLGARVYLTCALREVEARPVDRQQLDPGELRLLSLLDHELAGAGFRHLGFGHITPLVTYYDKPLTVSVFVHEQLPAYGLVRRHLAPEYGRLAELEVTTELASGGQIVTVNTPFASSFLPPGLRIEAHPGLTVGEIVARHAERLAGESVTTERAYAGLFRQANVESALALVTSGIRKLRPLFRSRKWVVPTVDPSLDRFTLYGALALTHYSRRVFATTRSAAGRARSAPATALSAPPSDNERLLRVEADLQAILQVAEHPETAPGIAWPLLTVIGLTAVLSFIAMASLWNAYVAAVILAAVTLHEAGHAMAMRLFGYRDIHVFFVPLLGAVTLARPAVTTVRDRLAVLLAGPVPGLWLAVLLLALDQAYGPIRLVRLSALALLILNGLNLLPFTPLDGGRALEALTRPESRWRVAVHGASAAGLLVLAGFWNDPVIAALGLIWAAMLPRQLRVYRLRRAVAARVRDRGDFRGVARTALEVMTTPPYARWPAATRQATARAIGRLFAESPATPADRRWGAIAYASTWIPLIAALLLWRR
jgi:Zn-dependent protease